MFAVEFKIFGKNTILLMHGFLKHNLSTQQFVSKRLRNFHTIDLYQSMRINLKTVACYIKVKQRWHFT